jgi:hypothetical protein
MTLTACGMAESGVKGAKGDTPVKYVICSAGEQNCFISARFKDLDSCQSHKNWSEMLCDSRSRPNEMLCRKDPGPAIGMAYCTL